MLLHASNATKHGHHSILIRTVDTDVVVLAISMAQGLKPADELWLAFGTGKGFRYFTAHEVAVDQRRRLHCRCSMHWLAVTLCPVMPGMVRRLPGRYRLSCLS